MKRAEMTSKQIADRDEIRRARESNQCRRILNKAVILLTSMYLNDFVVSKKQAKEALKIIKIGKP